MNTSPLAHPADARLAQIAQARQRVLQARQPGPSGWLDPMIERSWRRCLDLGHEPQHAVTFQPISPSALGHALDASHTLLQAATRVIHTLARALLHTRYFAILTDAHGTALQVHGPVDRSDPHITAIARIGIDLSEAAVGTTAIGTTLAEQDAVWLRRGEHFFQHTSVFSCAGAPIVGPTGDCVGMLDLTGVTVAEQPALKHLVSQSARSIENALTLAQPHLLLRLNWPGRVLGDDSDGLVCLDADGVITGINRPATQMLSARSRVCTLHADSMFALPHAKLFDAARTQRGALEVPLWSGLRLLMLSQRHREVPRDEHVTHHPSPTTHAVPLKAHEIWMIHKAVEDARGNVIEVARALGIGRATVYRHLQAKKYQCARRLRSSGRWLEAVAVKNRLCPRRQQRLGKGLRWRPCAQAHGHPVGRAHLQRWRHIHHLQPWHLLARRHRVGAVGEEDIGLALIHHPGVGATARWGLG
jgi:transcriptional regulator of acetoin/glycerol metabolism